jgi:hypothetical protein
MHQNDCPVCALVYLTRFEFGHSAPEIRPLGQRFHSLNHIRLALPSRRCRWVVHLVNRHEEAGADFVHNRVWIQRDWRSAVYDAGLRKVPELRSVKQFFPLSLKSVTPQVLHRMGSRVLTDPEG